MTTEDFELTFAHLEGNESSNGEFYSTPDMTFELTETPSFAGKYYFQIDVTLDNGNIYKKSFTLEF